MPYYLDAPTLAQATAVYTNAALTTCAADGIYSDGSVTRVQTGCVLGPAKFCPSCGNNCDDSSSNNSGDVGVYRNTVNVGSNAGDIGAIIIRFDLPKAPHGFKAVYDGITYNSFSSPIYGYMSAPSGLPVYMGDQDEDCGITSTSFIANNYDWDGGGYIYNGTTSIISVLPAQTNLTVNPPGTCIMVIPKVNLNPSSLDVTVESPCVSGFSVYVSCPMTLFPTKTSQVAITPTVVCGLEDKLTYYNYPVNGNGTTLGLYDWVFLDPYGESVVGDGYYYAPTMLPGVYDWFLTQNGVIIEMGECETNNFVIRRCATGEDFVANATVSVTVGDLVTVDDVAYLGCVFTVMSQTAATPVLTIDAISTYEACSDICSLYSVNNMTSSSHMGAYIDCAGTSQTFTIAPYTIDYICARSESITIDTSPSGVIVQINDCNCPS